VPYEDVGSAKDAGDVVVLDQSAATGLVTQGVAVSQDSPGVSGHAEAGDHFGAALASVESSGGQGSRFFVGVPGEAVGATRRAGIVQAFDLSAAHHVTQASTISQESPGVPGSSETDDRFGSALAISSGCQDLPVIALAIGAPGESIGSARGAGAVTFVTPVVTSADEDFCPITVRQGVSKIGGKPETGDRFGAALGELANPYGKPDGMGHLAGGGAFLIGVPGEDLGGKADAGAVQVDRNTGNVPSGSFYDSAGTAAGEQYGTVPAWSLPNFSCYC
jgi:hypothetical protein